ncbi:MAG: hypothetical protein Q9180_009359 [Flavoplaca navasiana]
MGFNTASDISKISRSYSLKLGNGGGNISGAAVIEDYDSEKGTGILLIARGLDRVDENIKPFSAIEEVDHLSHFVHYQKLPAGETSEELRSISRVEDGED